MVLLTIVFSLMLGTLRAECRDGAQSATRDIERLDRRYADFFRYREHLDARERARDRGRRELKAHAGARELQNERARLAYLRTRRPPPDHDAALEAQMEREHRATRVRHEEARRCYVQGQARIEKELKRGHQISGNQEFDLEP